MMANATVTPSFLLLVLTSFRRPLTGSPSSEQMDSVGRVSSFLGSEDQDRGGPQMRRWVGESAELGK